MQMAFLSLLAELLELLVPFLKVLQEEAAPPGLEQQQQQPFYGSLSAWSGS